MATFSFKFYFILLFPVGQSAKNPFSGAHVRAAVFSCYTNANVNMSLKSPPMMRVDENVNGTATFSGIDYDIFDLIMKKLNLTYTYVIAKKSDVQSNGIPETIVQMIVNKDADMGGLSLSVTRSRFRLVDYATPTFLPQFRLVVRYPDEENRLWVLVEPFDAAVWALLAVASASVTVCFGVSLWLYRRDMSIVEGLSQGFLFVTRIITSQGEDIPRASSCTRIITGVWCLMMVVLANSYSGKVTSAYAVPMLRPVPTSLEELAHSKEFSLVIDRGSTFAQTSLVATSGIYKIFGDTLRAHPDQVTQPNNVGSLLLTRKVVFPARDYVASILMKYNANASRCQLTYLKPTTLFQPAAIPLAKNSIYKPIISDIIQNLWENGLLARAQNRGPVNVERCLLKNRKPTSTLNTFNLRDLSAAFFILSVGLTSSIFVFFIEMIVYRCTKRLPVTDL